MSPNGVIYVTAEGLNNLKEELTQLKEVKRVEVAERLELAISHGDLSENADYDYAKQEQAIVESRIVALEDALRHAEVIEDMGTDGDCVRVGSTVTIVEDGWDDVETYRIVGIHEASPTNGLISNESPIGSALLGARVGEFVVAFTPGGETKFRVEAIQ